MDFINKFSVFKNTKGKKRYHFSIFLFGFASVIIRAIDMPAANIVAIRFLISAIFLIFVFAFMKKLQKVYAMGKRHFGVLLFGAAWLAVHGWAFATSIQLASVAIGTITFACFPVFSLILEKVIYRKSSEIRWFMLVSVFMTILGVFVLVPEFSIQNIDVRGILIGLLSAFAFAAHLVVNDRMRMRVEEIGNEEDVNDAGIVTTFYNHLYAAVILVPIAARSFTIDLQMRDIILLAVLGIIITAVGFTIYYSSLKFYNPTTLGIASSLEAVYGIVFAFVLLQAVPTAREMIGGFVIILGVLFNELMKKRSEKQENVIVKNSVAAKTAV